MPARARAWLVPPAIAGATWFALVALDVALPPRLTAITAVAAVVTAALTWRDGAPAHVAAASWTVATVAVAASAPGWWLVAALAAWVVAAASVTVAGELRGVGVGGLFRTVAASRGFDATGPAAAPVLLLGGIVGTLIAGLDASGVIERDLPAAALAFGVLGLMEAVSTRAFPRRTPLREVVAVAAYCAALVAMSASAQEPAASACGGRARDRDRGRDHARRSVDTRRMGRVGRLVRARRARGRGVRCRDPGSAADRRRVGDHPRGRRPVPRRRPGRPSCGGHAPGPRRAVACARAVRRPRAARGVGRVALGVGRPDRRRGVRGGARDRGRRRGAASGGPHHRQLPLPDGRCRRDHAARSDGGALGRGGVGGSAADRGRGRCISSRGTSRPSPAGTCRRRWSQPAPFPSRSCLPRWSTRSS